MSGSLPPAASGGGPIAWMVRNGVTPNLLMIFLLVGGLFVAVNIKKEVFPEFSEDTVTVSVSYPGSSPEEVEQGIVTAVEEAVRGVEGVEEVRSRASEGSGTVTAEIETGEDLQRVFNDIQQEVARIRTFPDDAEEPRVRIDARIREVLGVQIFGDVSEYVLKEIVEQVRDRLLQSPDITQVDFRGVRDPEIVVEISENTLRGYGLTLGDVAARLRAASVELPGGKIDGASGEILLRVADRRDFADQFARIPIVTTATGATVHLADIATVKEGFEDTDRYSTFNGKRSMKITVYQTGDQTPISVSRATRAAMEEIGPGLPPGIGWQVDRDSSDLFTQRRDLLLKNAAMGLVLVLLLLGLFLELKLAFWVTMGIPISFLGGLLVLPFFDVSINIISMFAFIIALGIVVDDAIVVGENVYEYRQRNLSNVESAIQGTRRVGVPIAFSILTNILAFLPIAFVPGTMGKIWIAIPIVVIAVFVMSWVESILILPAHLAHTSSHPRTRFGAYIHHRQQRFSDAFLRGVQKYYGPVIDWCLRWRLVTVSVGVVMLILTLAYVGSGRISLIYFPRVDSDYSVVTATLPLGSSLESAQQVRARLLASLETLRADHPNEKIIDGVDADIEENEIEVVAYLPPPERRPLGTREFSAAWREATGSIPGLESLRFQFDRGGPGSGAGLTVELSHRDIDVLDRASSALALRLEEFSVTKDINDGYTPGKRQINFKIKSEGLALGLTAQDIARQIRDSFNGAEAIRQQRGRDELKVRVRLPEADRVSEYNVESLLVRTPSGTYVPLWEIAEVDRGRAYTTINRRDGRRTVSVTADIDPLGETKRVITALETTVLPQLIQDFPGLTAGFEGRERDRLESMNSLFSGLGFALVGIYFLLAIPFRSYIQPMIVMASIPFAIVGAVLGHMVMGYNLSVISIMGIIALAGVVVNDSLVMIDYANGKREDGLSAFDAIREAGLRRFRPIMLTTLTTFGGLAPMIFETARQARFLIPMAISLGFGILFATVIALLLVPCLYMMVEDLKAAMSLKREQPEPKPIAEAGSTVGN